MSDLFGNHIVGFPTRRLKCYASEPLRPDFDWVRSSECIKYMNINLSHYEYMYQRKA